MSASEKLRVLEAQWLGRDKRLWLEARESLVQSLPQIVAVVEAAESVTFYGQEAHRYNEWAGSQIVLTLAALDETLGEGK